MFKWLLNILRAKPAPVAPVKKSVPFDLGEVKVSDLNMEWDITYEDRNGQTTERRITVKSLHGAHDYPKYVFAYCHLRKEPRHFNLYNIHEAYAVDTDEKVPMTYHLLDWIDNRLNELVGDLNMDWDIIYDNRNGQKTQHFITVKSLHGQGKPHYVFAYCHQQNQLRYFNVARIFKAYSVATGDNVTSRYNVLEWIYAQLETIEVRKTKEQNIKNLVSGLSINMQIVYQNRDENKSYDDIILHSFYEIDNAYYIYAYKPYTKLYRYYNLDNILEASSNDYKYPNFRGVETKPKILRWVADYQKRAKRKKDEFVFNLNLNPNNFEVIKEGVGEIVNFLIASQKNINTVKNSHIQDIDFLLVYYQKSLKNFNNQENENEKIKLSVESIENEIEFIRNNLEDVKNKHKRKQLKLESASKKSQRKILSDLSLEWDIVYENDDLETSELRIQVRSLHGQEYPYHSPIYIRAYCYQQKRVVRFNLCDILHAHSCETGEVVPITSNLLRWIKNQKNKVKKSAPKNKTKEVEEQ